MGDLSEEREKLVSRMINEGTLETDRIANAFKEVKRENFCREDSKENAYIDYPLPIGESQTISQPTTVGIMTEKLDPEKGDEILEVGAGSGYQAAILSKIVGGKGKVYTVEIKKNLFEFAKENLESYDNVEVFIGDASKGLPEKAPFDGIIVTAGAPSIPEPLKEQLKEGGKMVLPVGKSKVNQRLISLKKSEDGFEKKDLGPFSFVPLRGEHGI